MLRNPIKLSFEGLGVIPEHIQSGKIVVLFALDELKVGAVYYTSTGFELKRTSQDSVAVKILKNPKFAVTLKITPKNELFFSPPPA